MRRAATIVLALVVLGGASPVPARGGEAGQTRFTYSAGQPLSPAYEGWMYNADGSVTMYFGYMNTNWLQEFDIPIGPDNGIEPGGPDQGQPTHFYPRRSPFLFTIKVPKDFGTKELIWTLTANGRTEKAYASLKSDYEIDAQVISTEVGGDFGSLRDELRTNIAPELRVEGAKQRTVKVGEALTLTAFAGDPDNLPARRDGKPQPRNASGRMGEVPPAPPAPSAAPARGATNPAAALFRPPTSLVPQMGPGLHFSWIVYRGPAAKVSFDPDQFKAWTDTRAYANSAWSPPYSIPLPPPDGKWVARAAFSEPGTYVLRAVASDGALFTYDNVTVVVTR
jgi:autonomous glycyl radical cofactor GrcA